MNILKEELKNASPEMAAQIALANGASPAQVAELCKSLGATPAQLAAVQAQVSSHYWYLVGFTRLILWQ